MHLRIVRFTATLALLVLSCCSVWGQKDTGGITGTVRDSSRAVVSAATVRVADIDRGTEFVTTTNSDGEYVASPLKIGRYTVTVEKAGFKKTVAGPVTVDIQERPAIDVYLQVGNVQESVTVTSEGPLLETQNSELGQVIDSRRASNLPLNGRNYAQLALLGAGVRSEEHTSELQSRFDLVCRLL